MSEKPIQLLLIEDNPGDARLIREFLSEIGNNPYLLECTDRLSKGLELLAVMNVDLVLLDLSLPDSRGFDTFARVHDRVPDLPIVVVTGSNDEMLAVQAVQTGAQDYLVKGEIDSGLLSRAMRYAIERKKTEIALRKAREDLEARVEKRTADLAKANEELRSEIAERGRVEEALRREHSFRTAIIERAAEGLCVCHEIPDHPFVRFTVWNERMTEITGYAIEDVNRLGWYQSIHPEPRVQAKVIDRMARVRQGEDLISEEWQIIRADRRKRTVRISTSVLQSDDGLPHVLALMNDITEQKKAEAALKKSHGFLEKLVAERTTELRKTNDLLLLETSERKRANDELKRAYQQLRDIINFLPDATFVIDRQKRVIAWNRAIEEMTGVKQDEILGKGDYAYAVPFYGEKRPIIIDLVMSGEDEAEKQYDFVERKEKTVYGEVFVPNTYQGRGAYLWGTASPLFGQGGDIIGAIQSIRDISDRKQAQEAVRQSEEKYRQLFETVSDAILLVDAETRLLIDVNESALNLYGYTRDEFLGLRCTEITAQPDRSEGPIKETPAGKRTEAPLHLHRKKDGAVFPVEISSSTFILAGRKVLCGIVRDITERKRAEEAITQQLNFQQTMIDTIPSPIFYKDIEGTYLGCNSSFESYLGLCKADIVGKSVYDLAPRDLADIYRAADLALFQHPGVQQYESSVRYADGTLHDVIFTKGTFTDLDGKTAGLVGVMLDITKRKLAERELSEYRDHLEDLVKERTALLANVNEQLTKEIREREEAEQALRESQQMLQSVLDNIPVRVFWKNLDSNFLGCNRPFALDAGLQSPDEVIGKNDFEMGWAEQAEIYRSDDRLVMKTGRPKLGYEEPQTTPCGDRIWLFTNKVPLLDAEGRIKGVLGTYDDITERKRAEEAVHAASRYARSLIEASPDPLVTISPDGKITDVNSATETVTGYGRMHLIGTDFSDYFAEPAQAKAGYQAVFREGSVRDYPLEIRHRDGHPTSVLYNASVYRDEKGEIVGVFAAARDITERKRAERALRDASEKLKFFAYSVAHDLKSPAVGVYGLTKRLSKHARDVLDEKGRTYCDQILKVSEHIAALVEKINIYIATKEAAPLIETTNVTEILRMLREEFSAQLSLRRIDWLTPESEIEIEADRLSILRTFRNLVDNALKYGGESLTRISIGYEDAESLHIFSVSDNGKGLKEADSEKIFGLFQRNETSRGVEGAGLGLTIVKEIAEQHGGRVWVEPRGKRGITFYVSISKTLRPLQKTARTPRPR
ncbi:MAG: PAS domain S-box protein [Syntrophobacteraceae bacterium]